MQRPALLLTGVFAIACNSAEPLPADRADYEGRWRGDGVTLTITAAGHVSYDRAEGKGRVQVDGPIAGWKGDGFVVGVMTMKTAFEVTAPPHEVGGAWMMTVNGDELLRAPSADVAPTSAPR